MNLILSEEETINFNRRLDSFKAFADEVNRLGTLVHDCAQAKGFWDKPREFGTSIALIHAELSEAIEADRESGFDKHLKSRLGIEVELCDAIIRILDLAAAERLDIGGALMEKLRFNFTRPHKHGKKY